MTSPTAASGGRSPCVGRAAPANKRLVLAVRRASLRSARRPAAHPPVVGQPASGVMQRATKSTNRATNCVETACYGGTGTNMLEDLLRRFGCTWAPSAQPYEVPHTWPSSTRDFLRVFGGHALSFADGETVIIGDALRDEDSDVKTIAFIESTLGRRVGLLARSISNPPFRHFVDIDSNEVIEETDCGSEAYALVADDPFVWVARASIAHALKAPSMFPVDVDIAAVVGADFSFPAEWRAIAAANDRQARLFEHKSAIIQFDEDSLRIRAVESSHAAEVLLSLPVQVSDALIWNLEIVRGRLSGEVPRSMRHLRSFEWSDEMSRSLLRVAETRAGEMVIVGLLWRGPGLFTVIWRGTEIDTVTIW